MKRVGNAQTISDIEFIIDSPAIGGLRHSWTAHGVECTRERHRYSGPDYEFNIEIINLRRLKAGRLAWWILIVSELWQTTDTKSEIRNTKWLKVLSGRASDVKAWMRSSRLLKLDDATRSQHSRL